jgi:DNA-binding MarR family transcriptional regulator
MGRSDTSRNSGQAPTGLAAEIGKQRPFESLEEEVFLNLLRTQDRLSAQFERLFRAQGLSEAKYNALRILRGHSPAAIPTQRIAAEMVASDPDVTRLVDRLVSSGLAARDRCNEDRRRVLVRITDAGLAALAALDEPVATLHRRQFALIPEADLRRLNDLLVAARRSAESHDTNAS